MSVKEQMEKIYGSVPPEKIPWNLETPPNIIQSIIKSGRVKPCKAIELGCGAGNYVIYFSSKGFDTTGVDISSKAIEMAKQSSTSQKIKCNFVTADILGDMAEISGTYDFAYDWELLHHIFPEDREKYITNVHKLLNPGGEYLSVCFSEKSPQFGGVGKYRKTPLDTELYFSSENEMETLFEKFFKVEALRTITIQGKYETHKAILAFLKKR